MTDLTLLSFDTTGIVASVALQSKQILRARTFPPGANSQVLSSALIPTLQDLLSEAEVTFQDLDVIAVATGPGSFTGIRLGLAAAQGLALSTKAQIFAPTSLEILAFSALGEAFQEILVALDTKRGDYFCQRFNGACQSLSESTILNKEQIQQEMIRSPQLVCVTEVPQDFEESGRFLKAPENTAVTLINYYFFLKNQGIEVPSQLSPTYCRTPEFVKHTPPKMVT